MKSANKETTKKKTSFTSRKFLLIIFLLILVIVSFVLLYKQNEQYQDNIEKYIMDGKIQANPNNQDTEIVTLSSNTSIWQYVATEAKQTNQTLSVKYKEIEIEKSIERVKSFFQRYGAVLQGYEEIIVRTAYECGGDYKIIIGIAGNESGLGRSPYMLYNPFGYLNETQYMSWDESLPILVCKISQQHLVPCNNDLTCVINRYGGPDTDKEKWLRNVTWFMNQV